MENIFKKKNLMKIMNENGINRITPKALKKFEEDIYENICKKVRELKEKITIKGRKTLLEEDI